MHVTKERSLCVLWEAESVDTGTLDLKTNVRVRAVEIRYLQCSEENSEFYTLTVVYIRKETNPVIIPLQFIQTASKKPTLNRLLKATCSVR